VNCTSSLVNATPPIGDQLHPYIEVRQDIVDREPIEQVPAFHSIHASKNDIALGYRLDRSRRGKISLDNLDLGGEAHRGNGSGHDLYLGAFEIRVFTPGIEDSIEILLLDMIRVDQDKAADSEARELLDYRAAGP
jgi:hypothetical protein